MRTSRSGGAGRLVVLGWVLVLAGALLPWTSNRGTGPRWLVQLAEDDAHLLALYVGALLALGAAAALVVLRSPPVAVLVPALAGCLTLVGVVVATPRNDSLWDGVDSSGREVGGADPTLLGLGAVAALVGGALVLITGLAHARANRGRR